MYASNSSVTSLSSVRLAIKPKHPVPAYKKNLKEKTENVTTMATGRDDQFLLAMLSECLKTVH